MAAYWKGAIMGMIVLVALVGILVALTNLPVLTGCGYYAQCGASAATD
jgi:hypothetical protein